MDDLPVKALLVEDHDVVCKVEAAILQQLGWSVDAAKSGAQALMYVSKICYDIIFMDIGLPDYDGLTLVETIRQTQNVNQSTPIVALTAHSDDDTRKRAKSVGMNAYIVKPMTLDSCDKKINTLLKKSKQLRQQNG